jgi:uncharacterized membrane protein YqgA involved in biofilm formation
MATQTKNILIPLFSVLIGGIIGEGLRIEDALERLGRFEFYDMARGPDLVLAIATGEQRIYANLLLTIGVVMPA